MGYFYTARPHLNWLAIPLVWFFGASSLRFSKISCIYVNAREFVIACPLLAVESSYDFHEPSALSS